MRCVPISGVEHWLWRAVDEQGFVLDVLLEEQGDVMAAKSFFTHLLSEHYVPDAFHTDKLWSYGGALREPLRAP